MPGGRALLGDTLSRAEHNPSWRGAAQAIHIAAKLAQREQAPDLSLSRVKGKAFASAPELTVQVTPRNDAYSAAEIALAAGVPVERVLPLVGASSYVPYSEALRIGRSLANLDGPSVAGSANEPLFSIFSPHSQSRSGRLFLALSGSLHLGLIAAAILIAMFATDRGNPTLTADASREVVHLVFLSVAGPGGGGGGGGDLSKTPPPKALREGREAVSSPLQVRPPPKPIQPVPAPPEPKPLKAEPLPIVVAPIVTAPSDSATRLGLLTQAVLDNDSQGSGRASGVGAGIGRGTGEGEGPGLGPGSGGGTGGGAYRAGSGIEPPRLIRELKADYSEEARRRGVTGDVVLEIVVGRDGAVAEIKLLRGLGWGLDERAVAAVRQWRFAPARRLGAPVDVVVEVSVEFKLR